MPDSTDGQTDGQSAKSDPPTDDPFLWRDMLTHEEFERMSQMVDKIVKDD